MVAITDQQLPEQFAHGGGERCHQLLALANDLRVFVHMRIWRVEDRVLAVMTYEI